MQCRRLFGSVVEGLTNRSTPAVPSSREGAASAAPRAQGETDITDSVETVADAGNSSAEQHQYLTCAVCKRPVLGTTDVIEERVETWKQAVFPYELTVCDQDCWCYSATNPGDVRFDVVRVLPTAEGVTLRSKPTPEHSWFPGYAWRMAHCIGCQAHLGWGFCAPADRELGGAAACEDATPSSASGAAMPASDGVEIRPDASTPRRKVWQTQPVFHGLILTKLRPAALTLADAEQLRKQRPAEDDSEIAREASGLLVRMLSSLRSQSRHARTGDAEADPDDFDDMVRQLRQLEARRSAEREGDTDAQPEQQSQGQDDSSADNRE